jgi:uncharacterized protein (DUF1330 family)
MRVFAIFLENPTDHPDFAEYRKHVIATLQPFEGKFVVRGGQFTVLEGTWPFSRNVILEFPSREHAEGWYNSEAYQKILPLRRNSMTCSAIFVDAVD